jgi:competence protein ComGC
MLQMLLVLLSISLLVSTLIPSLRTATERNKAANEPRERLKVIYPTPLSPLQRK